MENIEFQSVKTTATMKMLKFAFVIAALIFVSQIANAIDRKEAKEISKTIEGKFNQSENALTVFDSNTGQDEYLRYAALNNPGLKAAFYKWKAAMEKDGIVSALPDPKFTYAYYIENVETRVGPQNQKFGLMQTFPWFGTLGAKGDMAFEAANAAYQNYFATKLKLFYKVKKAYSDFWLLGREIQLTRENLDLITFWESVARTRYKVARQKHHAVIMAQVELGKLDDQLKTLESMIQPVSARLRTVLNLSDTIELSIPSNIAENENVVIRDSILASVREFNPDILSIEHLIEKEKAAVRLANKSWFPNFTFGVNYIETGEAMNRSLDESGKDPFIVSLNVNLPIWFGKNKSKQNQAKARQRAAQYKLKDTENRLIEYAEKTIFEYEDAIRKIQLYRDGLVPKAEESLNATFTAYQADNADFLSVLDTQRQLLNFQLMLDRSKRNRVVKEAELELLSGGNNINNN